MPITIGAKRESDFTDPVGMLGDCHRRIERFLNVQVTLATREMNVDGVAGGARVVRGEVRADGDERELPERQLTGPAREHRR